MDAVYAGLDLGTSGCKGTVVTADGTVLARARAGYQTHRPEPGAAEQDPAHWLNAVGEVTASLADQIDPERWRGIGLSAMIPTLVLADAAGAPVGPAITWEDGRAEEFGTALREGFGPDALYRRTGQWVDGRYLVPMARRLFAVSPELKARASHLLGAKDYLFGALTGEYLTDPSTATGFGCYDLAADSWLDGVADGLPALPGIAPSQAWRPLLAGAVPAVAAGLPPGIPVCVGGADSVLGALGLGITEPGQVAYIAGTSNVILGLSDTAAADPAHRYLITPMPVLGGWGLEMDLLATGSAHGWLAGLLTGGDQDALARLAAGVDPEDAPSFLPYLLPGEQGARWDPDLAGTLTGLHLGHGPGHLARGLQTGIVAESRHCLTVLQQASGVAGGVFLAGGGATASSLAVDLADATGRPVSPPDPERVDCSAIGAAMVAAAGVDGAALPAPPSAARGAVLPDPAHAARWDRLACRHEATLAAAAPLYHRGALPPDHPGGSHAVTSHDER
ncbi:xylulokinase [Trebonia kvetii]|uniref:xylulokinase n=1 Tax=Trebonia kvetii TaxID=2480626 RepID=UPI002482C189|nr:FGGY family carbohydrate kinase [Trebonia kvetii]